jgi:WD40 repeat protein
VSCVVVVFRSYLQESGFVHSAFTFVYESMLGRSSIKNADKTLPPGALISFLQKGLQYVGVEESLHRESSKSRKSSSANDLANLSLLSPQTISALTRENPPITLNVPPAAAAAAVRARLEAEARIESDRKAAAVKEVTDQSHSNGTIKIIGPGSIPPQPTVVDKSQVALTVIAAQTVHSASAGAMSQTDQSNGARETAESAGAAALMAQQRRAVAEMAAIPEVQQRQPTLQELEQTQQLQKHLELQQTLQKGQLLQQQQLQHQRQVDQQAAAALASVAEQLSGNKRPASSKKAMKNKGKASKQQRQSPIEKPPVVASGSKVIASGSKVTASGSKGFASLEEAVARLEAAGANGSSDKNSKAMLMDIEENDQQSKSSSMPAHASLGSASSANELTNGKHGPGQMGTGRLPNGDVPSNATSSGVKRNDRGNLSAASKAASKGSSNPQENQHQIGKADGSTTKGSQIDREDELTNAHLSEVLELKMHSSEVFMCAWNPIFTDMIATGSGDASARIWQMGGAAAAQGLGPVRLLPHGTGPRDRKNKDVTTLEWSADGKLLATGSYDGVARVWSRTGALVHTLRGHKGPIFSLKWNKKGNYLLSGSYDKTTIVWDVSGPQGFVEQQFTDHQAPALDVDWKDNTTFASCSTDKTVHICKVGMKRPLKTYTGHTDEVNAVKWDPSGTLLASCSDDCTAKVWDVGSDRKDPMQDFKSHQQEIYTVKWCVSC